jgi:hypothetical protein
MGLKKLWQRWSKAEDARVLEQAEEETRMTPHERDVDREGFEGHKADLEATRGPAGSAADDVASEDLD